MKVRKFVFGHKVVRLAGVSRRYRINWVPDDLVADFSDSAAEEGRELFLSRSRFKSVVFLSDLPHFLSLRGLRPLELRDALWSAGNINVTNVMRPCLFPVSGRDGLRFLALYYSNSRYRFLEWVWPDPDIRISHYTCIGALN